MGDAVGTGSRTKFRWTETVVWVNEKVNNVALGRLDDIKLQKPFYLFFPVSPSTPFYGITH